MSKHEGLDGSCVSYKDTLNLPTTSFPIRAQAELYDQQLLDRWQNEKLYALADCHNLGKEQFILPDGPPYANGDIHLGHAYNKILKDIIAKSERMAGKHVNFVPVWDCHGLPIEFKVTQEQPDLTYDSIALKRACRLYAQKWVDIQKQQFKDLGLLMQWDKSCTTMDPIYEAQTLRAFGIMVGKGYVARKQKTVPWCMHCQTVLANAEIEYEDRKDPSVYVQFSFDAQVVDKFAPEYASKKISLLVWTTTPWTLPLNRAVVIKPGAIYQLVQMHEKFVIIGKELVSKVSDAVQAQPQILAEFLAEQLIGHSVNHPCIENFQVPVIGDPFVSLEDGTACVHTAPGCGPDDYEVGIKNGLEIFSPLTIDGRYTSEIQLPDLVGMLVTDGQWAVLKKIEIAGNLFFKSSIRHSYPHCWRCHNGLIFRATQQWFCDLSKHNLRDRALDAIAQMRMIPEAGKNRLIATISGRLEWCLSRQRSWGVPIPAVGCRDCNHVSICTDMIERVAQGVEKSGIEYWDAVPVADLLGVCQQCGSGNLVKESDILDVWFDSGVSHFAMLAENVGVQYPADLYLEGKDQHRGWFQSSLLTSLALHEKPCVKEIVTHGFTVDEKGRKMSKSIGNVVTPTDIIKDMGNDGLRLWVASNDYDSDPIVSKNLMSNVAEVHRKIRNTCRFLLSNLYDFDMQVDAVLVENMLAIDQYALIQLDIVNQKILQAYKDRKTTAVFHDLADYCVKELSSFYLDIVKDRLYVEKANGFARRSAQTVCYQIVDTLTKAMAPVLSFTAELIADCYQKDSKRSIHLQDFNDLSWIGDRLFDQQNFDGPLHHKNATSSSRLVHALARQYLMLWDSLKQVRSVILKQLEELRSQGIIKHSLDAQVELYVTAEYIFSENIYKLFDLVVAQGQTVEQFLQEYCIVSQIVIAQQVNNMQQVAQGLYVVARKAEGCKCARCWQWEFLAQFDQNRQLCSRCSGALIL